MLLFFALQNTTSSQLLFLDRLAVVQARGSRRKSTHREADQATASLYVAFLFVMEEKCAKAN